MALNQSSNSSQVQGTNDSSVVSKLSMVNTGYQDDNYLKCFVQKPQRRSSLINRGYYLRSKVIRCIVENFVQEFPQQKQIISLGAGFDTTYFFLRDNQSLPDDWLYVEIDYPEVINRKLSLAKLSGILPQPVEVTTSSNSSIFRCANYLAIGYDLRNAGAELTKTLLDCAIDVNQFSLFLSEVVLTYLTGSQSSRVLSWINHVFTNAMTVIFEQMMPNDSFGLVMCRHFDSLGSPLSSIHAFPTLQSHINRHKTLGFGVCSHTDLFSFFNNLPRKEQIRIENLEMFDEYEGWHLMSLHYFVLCSTNSKSDILKNYCSNMFRRKSNDLDLTNTIPSLHRATILNHRTHSLQMFGHSMCAYDCNKFLLVGGFGIPPSGSSSSHQRLNCISLFDLKSGEVSCSVQKLSQTMFGSMVKFTDKNGCDKFVVFGGRAAPNRVSCQLRLIQPKKSQLNHDLLDVDLDNYLKIDSENGPLPRWRHSATVLLDINDQHFSMIVIGGRGEKSVFSDCWDLNLETMKWNYVMIKSKSNEEFPAKHSHSSVWWKEKGNLVVSGGLNEKSQPSNDIIIINKFSNEFERLDIKPSLYPRYSHTSHIVRGNMLLLVGGVSFPSYTQLISLDQQSSCDHIAVVSLETSTWCKTVAFPTSHLQRPIRVHSHTSSVEEADDGNIELTLVGGGSNCFSFGTAFTHTPLRFSLKV